MQRAEEHTMQAAPVRKQQERRDDRERISRGRVIENSGHSFEHWQRHLLPDYHKSRPMPFCEGGDLAGIDIGHALDRREGGELENEIGEAEQNKDQTNAFEASDTTKSIAHRKSHRIKKHQQGVSGKETEQQVNTGQRHRSGVEE